MQSNFAQCTRHSQSRRRLTHMLSVGERAQSVGEEAGGSWEGGDVRVQRMFLGVVGKSRKMPGITKNTRDNTLADGGAGSWELLVRPDPPKTTNNKQMPRQADPKSSKNNKRKQKNKQTTRNEKRKKQMQIHRERERG